MTLVLVATPGDVNANSYVDVATASVYFAARQNADAFVGASLTQQTLALVAATQRLEQEYYVGLKATSQQPLKWPRYDVWDEDGRLVQWNVIPRQIIYACCELALHLLVNVAADVLAPQGMEIIDTVSVGSLTLKPIQLTPGYLPPQVVRWIRQYIASGQGQTRLERA